MSFFRYRRKSVTELLKKHVKLKERRGNAKQIYSETPINKRGMLLERFKKWVDLQYETNKYMIEVIHKFSPDIAKMLRSQATDFLKHGKELYNKKWESEYKILTEKQLNEQVKAVLDIAVQSGELREHDVNITFVVAMDTLRRVKGEYPLEPEERVLKVLTKHDSRLAEIYKGAYEALESNNPDRYRPCSVSMREIVDGTLGKTSEERKKTVEKSVRSKQESEIVKSLEKLVKSIDLAWNKGVHTEIQAETAFLAVKATELVVNFVYRLKTN